VMRCAGPLSARPTRLSCLRFPGSPLPSLRAPV